MTQVPVTVYVEMTPNPSTMKFVANKYLLMTGDSAEFTSKEEAKGYSPLAEELFQFPFVKSVFIAANFVTIAKYDNVSWDFVAMELREWSHSHQPKETGWMCGRCLVGCRHLRLVR